MLDDRLDGFQADFSFLLGASFANPDHAATHEAERVFIGDKFDHLAAPKVETSAQPEPSFEESRTRQGSLCWLPSSVEPRVRSSQGAPPSVQSLGSPDNYFCSCQKTLEPCCN